jgi:hypothetical protein
MRSTLFALLLLATAGRASAQLPCTAEVAQTHAYTIREVRISQPFVLVPPLRDKLAALQTQLNTTYANSAYLNSHEQAAAVAIKSAVDTLSNAVDVTKLRIVVGKVENCQDGKVDLVFTVVYVLVPTMRPSVPEIASEIRLVPASVAIGHNTGLRLLPLLGYDVSGGIQGGGSLVGQLKNDGCKVMRPTFVNATGNAGRQTHNVSAQIGGDCSKVAYREWSASYLEDLLPASTGVLTREGDYFYHRDLKPLKPAGLTVRLGGGVQGGNVSDGSLASLSMPTSLIGVKGAAGIAYVRQVQDVEVSLGEEIDRNLARNQWFERQVVDVRHNLWLPYGDHRDFEMESEFHAGNLFHAQSAPLGSTFLLDSKETNFVPSQNWAISSAPSIRSVSSKRDTVLENSGGKSYISARTLLGTNVFHIPLVPTSLTSQQEFKDQVKAGIESATASLTAVYLADDPHMGALNKSVSILQDQVKELLNYISQPAVNDQFHDDASDCQDTIQAVNVIDIDPLTKSLNVGLLQDLINTNDGQLTSMLQSCRDTFGAELKDSHFDAITTKIQQWQTDAITTYKAVDQAAASDKAKAILAEVTPVFHTLTDQVNTTSITPLLAVDYLRLVPRAGAAPVTLLGVGPAFRFTLVSSVNFTFGYSFNALLRSSTGPGAFFGSITFHDLIHF